MRIATIASLLLLTAASGVHAQCTAERTAPRPHLVELYTSVALAYHVDYWDYLGWRDRFADARYSQRQQAQAGRDGSGSVYTPQIVLDGHAWSGWYRAGSRSALGSPPGGEAAGMRLSASADGPVLAGAPLRVRMDTTFARAADAADYRNYVALSEDGLSNQVRAGENRGALLRHDHVVRAFAGPLPIAGAETRIALPADVDIAHASLVAFAQRASDGAIAQAVALPLAQCR
jgi:hypothetical protein